jgi:hypothetical protein
MRKEESAHMGQKIRTETSPDKSSHKVDMNVALEGRKMKGGPTDLSASLKAGSYNDVGGSTDK